MKTPVVLITGALTGIGRAAAIIFAREGAQIVVSGRRDKQGEELVAELQGLGAEAIFVRTDVRKDEDVRNLVVEAFSATTILHVSQRLAGERPSYPAVRSRNCPGPGWRRQNVDGTRVAWNHRAIPRDYRRRPSSYRVSYTYGGSLSRNR